MSTTTKKLTPKQAPPPYTPRCPACHERAVFVEKCEYTGKFKFRCACGVRSFWGSELRDLRKAEEVEESRYLGMVEVGR